MRAKAFKEIDLQQNSQKAHDFSHWEYQTIDLAKKVGTAQSNISRLESGNYNPTLEFLEKIANSLGKKLKVSFI